MINRVVLVGRLTRDPEIRHTQSGIAVARFTLACDRPFTGQDSQRESDFIQIVVWRKQAENAAKYLQKGHLCGIDGRLQVSSYEDHEGKRQYRSEVVADNVKFLQSKGSTHAQGQNSNGWDDVSAPPANTNQSQTNSGSGKGFDADPFAGPGKIDLSDDDLPF